MSNDLRIPGINTGMDTQAIIDKIIKYDKMPIDRLKQKQQLLIWKQEAYRTQNTVLTQLRDLVFNLKMESAYLTKTVTSTNSQIVTATPSAGAPNGSYSVVVDDLAMVATNTSNAPVSIRSKVWGDSRDLATTPIVIGPGNDQISVTVDGVIQTITLTDGRTYDGTAGNTLADLAADIQSKLGVFATPIYVKANSDNQLVFYAAQTNSGLPHTIVAGTAGADPTLTNLGIRDKATTKELVGNILTGGSVVVDSASKKFRITVGSGPAREVTLTEGTYNYNALAAEIQTQIQALGGAYANVEVSVTNFNQLRITPTDATPLPIKLENGTSNDVLWKMGYTNGTLSEYPKNTISTTATFWNQKDKFIASGFFAGKTGNSGFSFMINGQNFLFSNQNTLSNVINQINSNSAAGVIASYDEFNDKLTLTTTKSGDNNPSGKEIQIVDPNGFLGQLFNISETNEQGGTNAVVWINGVQTQRQSNTFTMNNINFALNAKTGTGPATIITVSTDTAGVVTKITDFVNKYNEVIAAIDTELTENRTSSYNKYTFYLPLTDDQKKELTEDEIKAWEDKAKQGILHNDSILNGTLSLLRASLYRDVDTPRVLTGTSLSGTINLTGSNHFKVTLGSQTREIALDELTYDPGADPSAYNKLVIDMQQKLDFAFGTGRIRVALTSSNSITLTSQNASITLNNGVQYNGINLLGFYDGVNVKATYSQLSQIGITTGNYANKGKLFLNTDTLKTALQNDPDGVMRLLTNSETITPPTGATQSQIDNCKSLEKARQGIYINFYNVLYEQITKITNEAGLTGTVSYANELGRELIDLGTQIDTTQKRINSEEDRLWNMFTQMEVVIGRMNSQSNWISNILGQMSMK